MVANIFFYEVPFSDRRYSCRVRGSRLASQRRPHQHECLASACLVHGLMWMRTRLYTNVATAEAYTLDFKEAHVLAPIHHLPSRTNFLLSFYSLLFHSLFKVEFGIDHFVLGEHRER